MDNFCFPLLRLRKKHLFRKHTYTLSSYIYIYIYFENKNCSTDYLFVKPMTETILNIPQVVNIVDDMNSPSTIVS